MPFKNLAKQKEPPPIPGIKPDDRGAAFMHFIEQAILRHGKYERLASNLTALQFHTRTEAADSKRPAYSREAQFGFRYCKAATERMNKHSYADIRERLRTPSVDRLMSHSLEIAQTGLVENAPIKQAGEMHQDFRLYDPERGTLNIEAKYQHGDGTVAEKIPMVARDIGYQKAPAIVIIGGWGIPLHIRRYMQKEQLNEEGDSRGYLLRTYDLGYDWGDFAQLLDTMMEDDFPGWKRRWA